MRRVIAVLACVSPAVAFTQFPIADQRRDLLSVDHYVRHVSTVPSIAGETVQLYVRERVLAATLARTADFEGRVVLFVHGAGTPAEVAFDVPHETYSWMAYLADAGFDVFSTEMTGYGRSTRPAAMNDPCNLSNEQRLTVMSAADAAACGAGHRGELTSVASDWDDIDAVVEYVRALRGVERVSLVGWSLGGPRAGGYAVRHPGKVERVVLLAPAYTPDLPASPPPGGGAVMTAQSWRDFSANWGRQVGCEHQYDPSAAAAVWSAMLASDPVGATWGPGVRRAPRTAVWGWNRDAVRRTMTPMLLVAPVHDAQITPDRVRALYDDLGSSHKVLVDLGCSSHAAMWERHHLALFRASLEWLESGTVEGQETGVVRLGYE
jgi:pimeloyl-ACP methyl ester carboxylesterase